MAAALASEPRPVNIESLTSSQYLTIIPVTDSRSCVFTKDSAFSKLQSFVQQNGLKGLQAIVRMEEGGGRHAYRF
jgi:hypothetical protein